jgi:hypothetical protein
MTALQRGSLTASLKLLQHLWLLALSPSRLLSGILVFLVLTLVTGSLQPSTRFSSFAVAWNAQGWEAITTPYAQPSTKLLLKTTSY